MKLTDTQESDLIHSTLGIGSPESRARGEALRHASTEAAEYGREIEALAGLIRKAADAAPPPLSSEQAEQLAQAVCRRHEQKMAHRRSRLWRISGVAAAACLALATATWLIGPGGRPDTIQAAILPGQSAISPFHNLAPEYQELTVGDPIASGESRNVRLMFPKGNFGLLFALSSGRVLGLEGIVQLETGSIFLRCVRPAAVHAARGQVTCERGEIMVTTNGDHFECVVYSGQARVVSSTGSYPVPAGHIFVWQKGDQPAVLPAQSEIPSQVREAEEAPTRPSSDS